MDENTIAAEIFDAALSVHRELGPGLLESVYESALSHELSKRHIVFCRQHKIDVIYKGLTIMDAFRADLLIEDKVIVELKSVEQVLPVHKKQLITYPKLSNCRLGLLLNFGADLIKNGVSRIVNNL